MARKKLVETFQGSWKEKAPIKRLPLNESKRMVESNGEKYEVLGAYKVPVWRLDKRNLNERVYSTKLAEKVIEENKATYACDGHVDDPTYADVKAVGKNPSIEDGIMYAECYFVEDEFFKKAERLIEAGVGLGLSSSAFGDQDDDGNILVEGFEIDRYFDFVLDPSYEVYMTQETRKMENTEKTNETLVFEESTTNTIEEKTNTESEPMKDKEKLTLEEKNIKLGVRNLMEKAEQKEHPKDRISAYREALDYLEGVEGKFAESMVDEITANIATLEVELAESFDKARESITKVEEKETKLTEQEQLLQEAQKTINALEDKSEIAFGMIEDFKARELKLKEMYDFLKAEKNGMISAKEYNELTKYIESLEAENDKLKKAIRMEKRRANQSSRENVVQADVEPVRRIRPAETTQEDSEEIYGYDKDGVYGTSIYEGERIVRRGYEDFEFDSLIDEDFRDREGVEAYYEELLSENKNVVKIKPEIMKCKTVIEAQKTYLNLCELIEDTGSRRVVNPVFEATKVKYREPSVNRSKPKGWV